MSCEVEIVADSIAPHGARITTYKLRYWRFVHSEFMTHRAISRNASSSRAIPVAKMIEWVESDPAMPIYWGRNQRGMVADEELREDEIADAAHTWLWAKAHAVREAKSLMDQGVHKQIASRLLEPFSHINVVATATTGGWMNFFNLRCHKDAMPEMRHLAVMMARAYRDSTPKQIGFDEWHSPFTNEVDELASSVARCARVSYQTFDGRESTPGEDYDLFERLKQSGHWSPFEHQAYPAGSPIDRSGNFEGWVQYRQTFQNQNRTAFDFTTLDQWT